MDEQNKVINGDGLLMKGGGIVIKQENGNKYVLMVYRTKHDDWSFPKGHTEHGESIQQTVIREVKEECGIETEIIKELMPNKYFNPKSNEEIICYMYLLKPETFEIKPENEGDKVEWILLDEVINKISHSNLKNYFNRVIGEVIESAIINENENK
ncbi:MAG: NUDIX domain-containing protein [Candidatus Buchananbacteria bacterium]